MISVRPGQQSQAVCKTVSGHCPLEEEEEGLRQDVEFINSINENTQCFTISGPNPGKPCIFPFKHNGKTFNGCNIDPDDRSKTWCSTKVDSLNFHVTGKGEFGHCGNNCQTNQPLSKFANVQWNPHLRDISVSSKLSLN